MLHIKYITFLSFTLSNVLNGYYMTIPTGYVGVMKVFNRNVLPILKPGLHFYNPLTTVIIPVEIRPQTDHINDVPCGSLDGVSIFIKKIEVGNQLSIDHVFNTTERFDFDYDTYLVKDKITHKTATLCASMSAHDLAIGQFDKIDDILHDFLQEENYKENTGLTINFVRLTKPELPKSLNDNYLALANEKALKKVIIQKQERIRSEKEIEKMAAELDNLIRLENNKNKNDIIIQEIKTKQEEQRINNIMITEEAMANANKTKLEAQALYEKFTIPGYVSVELAKALYNNQKIYYGEKLPLNFPLLNNNN